MLNYRNTLYIDTAYRPSPGSFGKSKVPEDKLNLRYSVNGWFDCRELWHSQLYNLNLFFYTHKSGTGKDIAMFLSKAEDILDLKNRSNFGPTQRKTIMWIEPSKWWTKPAMRRSLFTVLLRSAAGYSAFHDNFEQALYSNFYASKTRPAVEWFLKGNTVYTGKRTGWFKQFNNVDLQSESHLLAKLLIPER